MVNILGFCGTAKNTGKTTALNAVLAGAYKRGLRVALTGIGYDGEPADHITGLPKPRIYAAKDTLAAVAETCAGAGEAELEILERTGIATALGNIVVGRVTKPGLLLLAGPVKAGAIRQVNGLLARAGCDLILVDGALGRVAPMAETDGVVLATGAARQADIGLLARETAAIAAICALPLRDGPCRRPEGGGVLRIGSLLDAAMAEDFLVSLAGGAACVEVGGIVSREAFEILLTRGGDRLRGLTLVFADPFKLLASGEPLGLAACLERLAGLGAGAVLKRRIPLRLICVNPFYPRCRSANLDYEAAYVDKQALLETVARQVSVPVANVRDETAAKIMRMVL